MTPFNTKIPQPVYEQEVERCIGAVIREFHAYPELYLTESDLKCRLYCILSRHPLFRGMGQTKDGKTKTCYVHTETAYFVEGKLNKRRVDVTVVNPCNYDFKIKEIVGRKGYSFVEPSIGIELKLNKLKTKQKMIPEINKTLADLMLLKRKRLESTFYLLFLDRKVRFTDEEINQWRHEYPELRLLYFFESW